ncbi:conserved hypothetical protein [Candidatus Roizmanbacteria bacterium]|nr:conserved hypothetical protein [Candidatus Roizmanbacteria bacterium]
MKHFLLSLFLVLVPLQLGFLYLKNPMEPSGAVAGIKSQSANIENSVSIGEFRFSLFGYTSPYALVTFEGMGIFDQTTANNVGFFTFNNRFSPFSKREACLSSKDQFGRLSSPVCLPPFPVNYNVSIGPVIMPPTVSLDKKDYFMGDQVMLSGQAVPSTDVKLSIFGDVGKKSRLALIKSVEAFTFPGLTAKSDDKGNFSVNLPSSTPNKFRLFGQTDFKKSVSPNSVKLSLDILPVWMIIVKFFLFLFSLLKPRLLEILIFAEIIYIVYVIRSHFQSKEIVIYHSNLPMIEEGHLPEVEESHLPVKK